MSSVNPVLNVSDVIPFELEQAPPDDFNVLFEFLSHWRSFTAGEILTARGDQTVFQSYQQAKAVLVRRRTAVFLADAVIYLDGKDVVVKDCVNAFDLAGK